MSKEAENLLKAITDLATRLSDEWCRKSDAETKGLDLNEIYDKQATALIDAAFAKVREECAEKQLREAFAAGARYGGWQNSLLKKDGANMPVPNFDTWYFESRSAILGTEFKS